MTTLQTLNKVVEVAEKRRDAALAVLAQQQRERQAAQDQMEQLETYAEEARQRWQARSSAGRDAPRLDPPRRVMQKFEHPLEQSPARPGPSRSLTKKTWLWPLACIILSKARECQPTPPPGTNSRHSP